MATEIRKTGRPILTIDSIIKELEFQSQFLPPFSVEKRQLTDDLNILRDMQRRWQSGSSDER